MTLRKLFKKAVSSDTLRFQGQAWILALIVSFIPVQVSGAEEVVTATPNRPGVGDTTDITQKGILEVEYGWERGFRSAEFKTLTALSGLIRFGLAQDVGLRLGMDNYLSQRSDDPQGRRSGVGDISLGFKVRLLKQDELRPALAFAYDIKVPNASRKKGLGSGRVDHNLLLVAGKEILGMEWDLTYLVGWIGKESRKDFDDLHLWALSFSRPLFGPLGISGEIYGSPRLNLETPGFVSTDWALTYAVTPRVVFDAGVDIGLVSAASDVTYFAGVTIALVDLYRLLSP